MKRYEKLADDISQSIYSGMLRPGDRLPSVRHASSSRGISPATVFEAYYLLEARGLITARPRSGYYVSIAPSRLQPLPEPEFISAESPAALDVSELVFEVLEATRQHKVIPFGSAFPSPLLFPLARLGRMMASTIKRMDPWLTVENISSGDSELRRQISLRYLIDGLQVPADEIVITNGALEGLNLALTAITRPGDTVLIESPTFYAALQSIERNGLKAIELPSHPETGINLESLEKAIKIHRPKACWLMTNFQNPQGSLMPEEQKRHLVELITRYEVPLIEDDVYGELYFGNNRPASAKAYDKDGWVIHCSSFSKCLAPGYRVGWVAPGRFSRQVERLKLTTTLATAIPSQQAIAAYLEKGGYDRHLRQLRHTLMLQQMKYLEAIEQYFPKGTRVTRPQGGYFFWIKLPGKVNALDIHHHALNAGISIAPGPIFSAQRGFNDYIRLNYGHPWDESSASAMTTLGKMIRDYSRI